MREFETTWKATKQAVFDTVAPATDYVADAEARRQQRLAELLAEFVSARCLFNKLGKQARKEDWEDLKKRFPGFNPIRSGVVRREFLLRWQDADAYAAIEISERIGIGFCPNTGEMQVFRPTSPEQRTVIQAARRYIIARDFNEFDPGKADMLWKLQNGGAI